MITRRSINVDKTDGFATHMYIPSLALVSLKVVGSRAACAGAFFTFLGQALHKASRGLGDGFAFCWVSGPCKAGEA